MQLSIVCFFLLTYVNAAVITLTKPSDDDFYIPQDGFEDAEPGEILKIRKTPNKLSGLFFPNRCQK